MKYIKDFREGERISGVYLCKNVISAVTKNGKNYLTATLMDKTGTVEAKIWDPNDPGIADFDKLDYVEVFGEVTVFNGSTQLNTKRVRVVHEGEYDPAEYLPMSKRNNDEMYKELLELIASVKNPFYNALLNELFVKDEAFVKQFRNSSAAKTVHHGYVGGLLEHTLGVTNLCVYYCKAYPVLKRDLLLTAAMCHDIAKVYELSAFPVNDYTDDGQLLGHIVMGAQMVGKIADSIPNFPPVLKSQLQHCILAHHGKYEFGSPKLPAIIEAMALNYADDTDAKMEIFKEILENNAGNMEWLGFNRMFESNLRATRGLDD